jgi:hypothetical protein
MANLEITKYPTDAAGNLTSLGVLGGQSGSRVDLEIGAEVSTSAFTAYTLLRLLPGADCVIRIGAGATAAAATGERLKSGIEYMRYVQTGERLSVIAP